MPACRFRAFTEIRICSFSQKHKTAVFSFCFLPPPKFFFRPPPWYPQKIKINLCWPLMGLNFLFFICPRLPLSFFYENPYLQLPTEAKTRFRAFPKPRRCGFALS